MRQDILDRLTVITEEEQEILPAGERDIAVNFIILPEFFDRTLPMMERENILRDFLVSSLSSNSALTSYLHFQAKEIVPVQNLIENMIWTLLSDRKGINTLTQMTMGLIFMNLSAFADTINLSSIKPFLMSPPTHPHTSAACACIFRLPRAVASIGRAITFMPQTSSVSLLRKVFLAPPPTMYISL